MLVSVFCRCDEFVCGVECCCFEMFVAVCGSLTSECRAGDAADVSGQFRGLCVAPDDGRDLLEKCFTDGLGNVLGDECLWDGCCPSGLPAGKEKHTV